MNIQQVLPYRDTLRKRISRENETPNQNEKHHADDRENKRKERGKETVKKRETRLKRDFSNQNINIPHVEPLSVLAKSDQNLLQNFYAEINKLTNILCLVCNECFSSIELIKEECCHRCYYDKNVIKKFSKENNMDLGNVPEELQGLTEIEEMLIAQIFPVVSVYRLRGGQYAYRGNVINFPQDVSEFTTRLPRHPSSLDILVVRHQSANSSAFRDFNICRVKLPQLEDVEDEYFDNNDNEDEDIITSNFVSAPLPSSNEESAIADTLGRMQASNLPIMWLNIDRNPINEFQTPGYIARAFPTLYPTGDGDLRSEHVREIKPAGYFLHLLKYKDGRFAQHAWWRYFVLNSQMRWRALQEGKVYVKQSLNREQLNVKDVQEMVDNDNCIADKIVRFGEGLHGTRQFWNKRQSELMDMIRQLGSQGMVFFTFSTADLHWPELHELMPHGENLVTELDTSKQRRQDLIDNPHIAAWFEWQHCGSTHVHGIGKIQDVPIIEWERMKENEETMSNVVQYLDLLVTMINPGLDAPVPNHHLCQKCPDEMYDDLQDYIELVNKLQRYTHCSPSYCLRVNSTGQQNCRYASKSELQSAAFSDILNRILNNSRTGDSSLGMFQKLLLHTIAERDISTQETCHLLLSIPLYHSSHRFVTLNLNKEAP
ncbi:10099_t:CDS:2 [Cetraspora pellucida]|uniref:10099_t:CDS:1 n=1 Tax=Cetraspora pellucida TaxID=1433469 RepID=A0A9N9P4Q1_9GLOM|nr:10099_t:CDS:2 [Cetraspora pellucida]